MLMPWRGRKPLPEADALLLHAYAVHKASLCPCGCGFPRELTLDPNTRGAVEIDGDTVCAVRAALDEWNAEQKEREPGVLPLPVVDEKALAIGRALAAKRSASRNEG